ncbi:disulfide bond formation protein B [Halomonas sp. YLGW01]|uniref:disulfide bond formation protein B n=1 Tax=Halomonas sp. YLGW01 TaxID=2773308 RepID=UPI001781E00C|nr:disulfide bond formation protein B [Halomonas sp. YLGW01]
MIRFLEAWTPRRWALAGLGFCVLMMGVALFLEHVMGLEPCPLCIFQRVAVLATALVLGLAALHGPRGRGGAVYGLLGLVTVAAGIGLAWRHLWLQSLPPSEVPSCGPGLDYMLEILPLADVLNMVLVGSGECAEVGARLLGLSLPGWTLIGFLLLALAPLGLLHASLKARSRQAVA